MTAVNLGERQLKKIRVLTRLGMVIKKTDFSPADGELMELKCIADCSSEGKFVRILIFNLKMEAFEKGNINSGKISDNWLVSDWNISCKELDFETGTGNIVWLPNQTLEILAYGWSAGDKTLGCRYALGIGPFITHPDTPLAGINNDDFELLLRVIATARLITSNTNIPATTALAILHPQGRLQAL